MLEPGGILIFANAAFMSPAISWSERPCGVAQITI